MQSLLFLGLRSEWIGYQRLSHLFKKRITQPCDSVSPWGPAETAVQGRHVFMGTSVLSLPRSAEAEEWRICTPTER